MKEAGLAHDEDGIASPDRLSLNNIVGMLGSSRPVVRRSRLFSTTNGGGYAIVSTPGAGSSP